MNARASMPLRLAVAMTLVSLPAWGQTVTFADLDGLAIEANVVREQVLRRDGPQFPIRAYVDWKIVIGPKDTVQFTYDTTVETPVGRQKNPRLSGSPALGQMRQTGALGGGQSRWQFEDGTLQFMRTFQRGAFKTDFAFSRSAEGFACTVNEVFAREGGTGIIVWLSPIDGKATTLVSGKQASSTCRVSKP